MTAKSCSCSRQIELTPQMLLKAYASGIFPMSESRDEANIFWVNPEVRAILPLEHFHVSHSLRKKVRSDIFEVTCNAAFIDVIKACAKSAKGRKDTWINNEIIRAYTELHHAGFAHSLECWHQGKLAGGLYGVAIGGAFCGESMFHNVTDASKVALVHLVARLKLGGYVLLDTQFVTDHLKRFGVTEIPAQEYLERLNEALEIKAEFYSEVDASVLSSAFEELFTQSITHTS